MFVFTYQILIFVDQLSIKIQSQSYVFLCFVSRHKFSSFFLHDAQSFDFGTPFRANGTRNRPSGGKEAEQKHKIASVNLGDPGTDLFTESIPIELFMILVDL